ncbi:MAG: hypothetical protein H0Z31_01105 [Bacillus sp. (in: Bacteria)]|nr:hypothetical protein [Bacillus sp. (in: firmicutes)]
MTQFDYSKRAIVFLDILGFREIVYKSLSDDKEKNNLFQVLRYIEEQRKEQDNYAIIYVDGEERNRINLDISERRVTTFSDSIVISYPDDDDGRMSLLWEVVLIQCYLGRKGYLTRGGITHGDLYHKDNIVVGPAMIEAYELESKVANYPRVILSVDYFEKVKNVQDVQLFNLLKQDRDGFHFTNFACLYKEKEMKDLKSYATKEINSTKNKAGIYAKLSWLVDYLNDISNNKGL